MPYDFNFNFFFKIYVRPPSNKQKEEVHTTPMPRKYINRVYKPNVTVGIRTMGDRLLSRKEYPGKSWRHTRDGITPGDFTETERAGEKWPSFLLSNLWTLLVTV